MIENVNPFELLMLICFGVSWPFQVFKTISTGKGGGKSPIFLAFIIVGYSSGVCYKLTGSMDRVIFLYIFNGIMVTTEFILYFRYSGQNET